MRPSRKHAGRSTGAVVLGQAQQVLLHKRSIVNEVVFVVEEAPEGGWTARALGHSIFTESDTLAQLRLAVQDAVRCHFEEGAAPGLIRLHFVREELLRA